MYKDKLKIHVKLCIKNLKNKKVKCYANCPFKEEILEQYPELTELFESKEQMWSKPKRIINRYDTKD